MTAATTRAPRGRYECVGRCGRGVLADGALVRYVPSGAAVQLVELPLEGPDPGAVSVVLVLPAPSLPLDTLAKLLAEDPARLPSWVAAVRPRDVEVTLPRFRLACDGARGLQPTLSRLGVREVFQPPPPSRLSRASAEPLHVLDVHTSIVLEVDESGGQTVGSGTYGSGMMTGALRSIATAFRCTRPFLMCLRERQSGLLLAVAKVESPEFPGTGVPPGYKPGEARQM